jgi:hypothetical protein
MDSEKQARGGGADRGSQPLEEWERLRREGEECLDRVRGGGPAALAEMKQFWQRVKALGAASGAPSAIVLGSALETLSEAWQRARAGGREHPDAARVVHEALEALLLLVRGEVPRGSGMLKALCLRAAEVTQALTCACT